MTPEPRRPGRPARAALNGNGAPPKVAPAPRPPTATQQLAALEKLRQANGGYVLPPPPGIAAARLMEPVTTEDRAGQQLIPNKPMKNAWTWLQQIAAIGGPSDLRLAWETWSLPDGISQTINPKLNLLAAFEQLAVEAGRCHSALLAQAEAEALPAKVVVERRRELRQAEERLAQEMRYHIAPLQAQVDRARRLLAEAEAALKEAA